MINAKRRTLLAAGGALGASALVPHVWAQAYPNKPVRILVGASPGGPADFMARAFADAAGAQLGQSFVVENRAGAGGTMAAGMAAKSAADGYTLFAAAPTSLVTAAYLFSKLEYDPQKDLVPITLLGAGAFVLAVHPSLGVNNVKELIALAKAKPKGLSYGSGGNGSSGQLCMESLASAAGFEMLHVPYKGDAPAAIDLVGGQLQAMFTAPNVAMPHHQSGKLKIIAVSSRERMPSLPDVPAVFETVPGFEYYGWIVLTAPQGTPQAVFDTLANTWAKAKSQSELKNKLDNLGMFPPAHLSERKALLDFIASERRRTESLVKKLGITPA